MMVIVMMVPNLKIRCSNLEKKKEKNKNQGYQGKGIKYVFFVLAHKTP